MKRICSGAGNPHIHEQWRSSLWLRRSASLAFLQFESQTASMIGAISQPAAVTLTTISQNKPIAVERDGEWERTTDRPSGDPVGGRLLAQREEKLMLLDSRTGPIYIRDETQEDEKWHLAWWAADYWPHHQDQKRDFSFQSGLTYSVQKKLNKQAQLFRTTAVTFDEGWLSLKVCLEFCLSCVVRESELLITFPAKAGRCIEYFHFQLSH